MHLHTEYPPINIRPINIDKKGKTNKREAKSNIFTPTNKQKATDRN